jgi:hypothetical protein
MSYFDRDRFTSVPAPSEPVLSANPDCPSCRASRATTTSKTLSASTYWRCLACGNIWNPSRITAGRRPGSRGW